MGALRLARVAFAPMPPAVAGACLGLACAIVGFAVWVARTPAVLPAPSPAPRLGLEPAPSEAPAPPERGDVYGVVQTTDGRGVGEVPVELDSRPAMGGTPQTLRTLTADDGTFVFRDVEVNPGSPWVAVAHLGSTDFPSDLLRTPRDRTHPVVVTVAPVTRSPSSVVAEVESVAVVGDEQGLQAVHALTLRKAGPEAFAGPLRLPVLPGGTSIDVRSGLDLGELALTPDGQIVSHQPLLPGPHEITYTYVAPMRRSGVLLRRHFDLRTRRFEVLVGGKLVLRDLRGLTPEGKVVLAGRTYHRYRASNLSPGSLVSGRLLPASTPPALRAGALALGVLAALVILLAPLSRRRRQRVPAPEPAAPPHPPLAPSSPHTGPAPLQGTSPRPPHDAPEWT